MAKIDITQGFATSPDPAIATLECVNLYPHVLSHTGGLSTGGLLRTPGISQTLTFPGSTTGGRGFHKFEADQRLFAVVGQQLFTINDPNTITLHGTINGSSPVVMADNGSVMCIVTPGGDAYFYTPGTDNLAQIVDPVFLDFQAQPGGVISVSVHDQRFVYATRTEIFLGGFITDDLGRGFNALAFDDAEFSPDRNQGVYTVKTELLVFGTASVEYYRNTGDTAVFPYVRIPGATIEKGAVSPTAIVRFDNEIAMLGGSSRENTSVWLITAGRAEKLGTPAIDTALQAFENSELLQATAWTYSAEGANFLGFNVGNKTFVYDATASKLRGEPTWHTRESLNSTRWLVSDITPAFNGTYVLDSSNRLGRLDRSLEKEFDVCIERSFTGGYIVTDGQAFVAPRVELSLTAGTGTTPTAPVGVNPRENPLVELNISKDGGHTFSSLGSRAIGAQGAFNTRQIWRRLGRAQKSLVLRFLFRDMIDSDIQRLDIDLKG